MAYYLTNMSRRRIIASQPNEITREGSIVTFGTNLVRPMLVTSTITPVQDLSGGAPYPPGGGKNLFNPDSAENKWVKVDGTIEPNSSSKSMTLSTTAGTKFTLSNENDSSNQNILMLAFFDSNDNKLSRHAMNTGGKAVTATAPADTAYVIASFYAWSLVSKAQLEIGTLTPYSPYSHICPIYGWTGAEVTVAGVNLCAGIENGAISQTTGENTSGSTTYRTINHIPVTPNGSISVSGFLTKGNIRLFKYGEQRKYIESVVIGLEDDKTKVITMDANTHFIRFQAGSSLMVTDTPIQAETGSMATAYEAFGTTLSVDWQTEAGTVYGGTLKVNKDGTGTLTVTSQKLVYDGSDDEGWTKNGANGYTSALTGYTGTPICNYLKGLEPGSSGGLTTWSARLSTALTYFMAKPDVSVYDTAAKWKTYLSENNLEAVMSLATPVTYTLTYQQVGQLLSQKGLNNVWADTGDVEVKAWGF